MSSSFFVCARLEGGSLSRPVSELHCIDLILTGFAWGDGLE